MTFDDTARVLAIVSAAWPHSVTGSPRQTAQTWHAILGDVPTPEVEAAVKELVASGREHAPPVGVILATAVDRAASVPEWDEVRDEILRMVRARGRTYPPSLVDWSHPAVAAFMANAWDEWCAAREGDGTFYAQQRNAWAAWSQRVVRDVACVAIGAPRRRRGLSRVTVDLDSLVPGAQRPQMRLIGGSADAA